MRCFLKQRMANGEWRVVKRSEPGAQATGLVRPTPNTRHLAPFVHALALAALTVPCFLFPVPSLAQSSTYHLGRTPTQEEIKAWDIAIGPEGKELPPGSGTAKDGATIYTQRCAQCHGQDLKGGPMAPALVGGKGTLNSPRPVKTIGSYWAYATTVFDYVNRTMPWNKGGSLSADELYAVTAYLLYKNDIIQENDVMNAQSLPKVQMPNRNGFVPARPEWKPTQKPPSRQR